MVFLGIGWLLLTGLEFVSKQWPPNFTHVRNLDRIYEVLEESDRLEVLVLGNSHAEALDWTEMGVIGTDLGLPWNEAVGVEHQVEALLPDLPGLHTALIAITPITFRWDNDLAGGSSYLFSRRLFHSATPYSGLVNGDWHSYVRGRAYWLVREDNWYRVILGMAGRDPYTEERDHYYNIRMDTVPEALLNEHAENRVALKVARQEEMTAQRPGLERDGYHALSTAIRELQEEGIRVILFTPPYYPRYVELYEEHPAWAEMQVLARRLARKHGVAWHDFSSDTLSLDHTNFRDSDHLNDRGKVLFTRRFVDTVCSDEPPAIVDRPGSVCLSAALNPVTAGTARNLFHWAN